MDAPARPPEEAEANASFAALLNAMARPGRVHVLPEPGFAPVISALIDRECTVFAPDPLVVAQLMKSGARLGEPEVADFVFCTATDASALVHQVRLGSDYYPDDGATLVMTAQLGTGARLRLTGPGIDGDETLDVDEVPPEFWSIRATRNRYPQGFDIIIIDQTRIAAIPRSSGVEVL